MSEETYDAKRAQNLEALLVSLSARITELSASGQLLRHASELVQLIGHVRSELFHYEVRATYDTPEVAESRRVVRDALDDQHNSSWQKTEWTPDSEDDPTS